MGNMLLCGPRGGTGGPLGVQFVTGFTDSKCWERILGLLAEELLWW